ncbi:methionine ABC transporter ATP-binding protein [Saccharibacillus sp. CPCC 101409]|uniref:methionine ABC transporter ATP-binding protein n=1 Tax=Saccharibacillus sp. CPCC 101409 TaxID=3058041 RepID=UPI0026721C70|nr:methionine ABC transporter ATP-binding protein [Saccharibacillus sp. CPCC 101409]MDO3411017.1 methionine ABC transporter ATP-binding protein [Saccharibacillus sp. CPCC 101409]
MITIKNLVKTYGTGAKATAALKGINLEVAQGEIFGIIGHSGAGKSTLIRCINMLEEPTSGSVTIGETDMTRLGTSQLQRERRRIGMIFQHFNLLSSATVYDNIAFPLRLVRTPRAAVDRKVKEMLELVGLTEHAKKFPAQLSGGQKQRVGIARALATDPRVLLCDEATSALDPQTTDSILRLLLDINRKLGLTIVLITHEMHVIQSICDKVAVIHGGVILEEGPVIDVFLKPREAVTRDFIRRESDSADVLEEAIHAPHPESARTVKVTFIGDLTYQSILSQTVKETNVDFAILQGTISRIKETPYGQLIVRFEGTPEAIERTLQRLAEQKLEVEEVR